MRLVAQEEGDGAGNCHGRVAGCCRRVEGVSRAKRQSQTLFIASVSRACRMLSPTSSQVSLMSRGKPPPPPHPTPVLRRARGRTRAPAVAATAPSADSVARMRPGGCTACASAAPGRSHASSGVHHAPAREARPPNGRRAPRAAACAPQKIRGPVPTPVFVAVIPWGEGTAGGGGGGGAGGPAKVHPPRQRMLW